jgi:hypothetical protein
MMEYHEATAETLRRLLLMFEGVTVDRLRTHPSGSATAILRIAHPASVARFACYARNTNVAFIVWGESWGKTEEEWASPERVRYELSSGGGEIIDVDGPSDPPVFSIHLFCAHLVRDLAGRGRLDRAEANRLLGGWGLGQLDTETCAIPRPGREVDPDK